MWHLLIRFYRFQMHNSMIQWSIYCIVCLPSKDIWSSVTPFILYHYPLNTAYSKYWLTAFLFFLETIKLISNPGRVFSHMSPSLSNFSSTICMTDYIISLKSWLIDFFLLKIFPEHHFNNSTFTACHYLSPLIFSK